VSSRFKGRLPPERSLGKDSIRDIRVEIDRFDAELGSIARFHRVFEDHSVLDPSFAEPADALRLQGFQEFAASGE